MDFQTLFRWIIEGLVNWLCKYANKYNSRPLTCVYLTKIWIKYGEEILFYFFSCLP